MSDSKFEPCAATKPATPSADSGQPITRHKATEGKVDEGRPVEVKSDLKVGRPAASPARLSSAAPGQSIHLQSAPATNSDEPKSREVRLGLVLYGGVSLAIYMNGVAHEFYNAVRGRGIYRLIKTLTDSDIIVDIISGASAGGINGMFLAFALCNEREFAPFKDLWRKQGDMDLLLRNPKDSPNDTHSLFDSECYYQAQLENALRRVYAEQNRISCQIKEAVSSFSEMDVFLAGTDMDGHVFTTFDDLRHPIDVMDHRTIFQLKHRRGRKEPLNPHFKGEPTRALTAKQRQPNAAEDEEEATITGLATLCRLTSCFPAAFRPVNVPWDDEEGVMGAAYDRLRVWGNLRSDRNFKTNRNKFFVDGGVLNNKPFTSTLNDIYYRMADSEVERFLVYVEPDPERFSKPTAEAKEPSFGATILNSLVSLPGYQSIGGDLQSLAAHNAQVDKYRRLTEQLRARVRAAPEKTREEIENEATQALYLRSRLDQLSDRVVRGVLRVEGGDTLLSPEEKDAAQRLFSDFDEFMTCHKPEEQWAILSGFDVYFQIRRLFYVVRRIREVLYSPLPPKPPEGCPADKIRDWEDERAVKKLAQKRKDLYERLRYALNRQIELLQIVQTAMEKLVDEAPIPWLRHGDEQAEPATARAMGIWAMVQAALKKLIDADPVWTAVEVRANRMKQEGDHRAPQDVSILYTNAWPLLRTSKGEAKEEVTGDWIKYPLRRENKLPADGRYLEEVWLTQNWLNILNDVLADRLNQIVGVICKYRACPSEEIVHAIEALVILPSKNAPAPSGIQRAAFRSLLEDIGGLDGRVNDAAKAAADSNHRFLSTFLGNGYDGFLWRAYISFPSLDAMLFPIELASDLQAKDVIKTVRISPFDARKGFSDKKMEEKVAGLAFHHFGAFFKRSWRSNDILWGRLDGICQLAECLLTRDRMRRLLDDDRFLVQLQKSFGLLDNGKFRCLIPEAHPLHPRALFPSASVESCKALREWIEALLSQDNNRRKEALERLPSRMGGRPDDPEKSDPLTLVVAMAQYEVINESYQDVAEDAAEEQLEWNYYQRPSRDPKVQKPLPSKVQSSARKQFEIEKGIPLSFDPSTGNFVSGGGYLEPSAIAITSAAAAVRGIEAIRESRAPGGESPLDSPLGRNFSERDLGPVNLPKVLPPAVLAELMARTALILRNCVVTTLGKSGEALQKQKLFTHAVDWPLHILYRYAQWWRATPSEERYRRTTIWAVCVALLLVGIGARDSIIYTSSGFSFFWASVLILAPVAVLILMYFLGRLFAMKQGWMLAVVAYLVLVGLCYSYLPWLQQWMARLNAPHPSALAAALPVLGIAALAVVGLVIGLVIGLSVDLGRVLREWWAGRREPTEHL